MLPQPTGRRARSGALGAPPVKAPTPLSIPDAATTIRAANVARGKRLAVLDDDPTGSQAVHDVTVVTAPDADAIAAGLEAAGATCFVLTNTRSLPAREAASLTYSTASEVHELARRQGVPITIVSRGDSTLRGHLIEEVEALTAAHRDATGRGYDGVLLAPAYFEAGRCTAGDVHWARVDGRWVPVAETEFANDATFGYRSSDLRELVAEKSGGAISVSDVACITLDDIRRGGPARVTELLSGVRSGQFVVVNATEYADFEIVVLGLLDAEQKGRTYLPRTGPSFVRALAGIPGREPLIAADVFHPHGRSSHGLVVVGSHVGLTSRQVAILQERGGVTTVELDVHLVANDAQRARHVSELIDQVGAALTDSDVILMTSRTLLRGTDGDHSLGVARAVSGALVEVVRGVRPHRPSWVVAKGGITSHDVACKALGIVRATVVGQMGPGIVSLLRPLAAAEDVVDMPYVVFAGNVGDQDTLADVVTVLRGEG